MKKKLAWAAAWLLFFTLESQSVNALAQGTAFTYQGRLNSGGGLANGSYDLTFTLFSTNIGGVANAGPVTNSAIAVSNGLFTTAIDFGPSVFTGGSDWLEIAVRTNAGNGFTTLSPRQPITAAPYAIMANSASNLLGTLPASQLSGTIPAGNVSGAYSNAVSFNNGADSFDGTFTGQFFGSSFTGGAFSGSFFGDGGGLYNLNASQLASGTVPDARLAGNVSRTNQVWLLNGNAGTSPNVNFIGTTDNQPLIVRVNGQEAARFEPGTNTPNVIGGYGGNYDGGVQAYGLTIGGGGGNTIPNGIQGTNVTFATIGGGAANTIAGNNAYHAVIGGGSFNTIAGDNVVQSTIAGGSANTIQGWASAIGGGTGNLIQPSADHSIIAAGFNNWIQTAGWDSVIGGGYGNVVQTNGEFTVIGGGEYNTNGSSLAFIGGGSAHLIQFNNWGAFIGGGFQNTIQSGSGYSAIASGYQNSILTNSSFSSIGGGIGNQVQTNSQYSVIGGGYYNVIPSNSLSTFVGGGSYNSDNGWWSAIGGGYANVIASAGSFIGGGYYNNIQTNNGTAVIGGGDNNAIQQLAYSATIAGGTANMIQSNAQYASIGGGNLNLIEPNNYHSVISGGSVNTIQTNAHDSVVAGGYGNTIQWSANNGVIGGGYTNTISTNAQFSTIGGGASNLVAGTGATVAGGFGNAANGLDSYAAGTGAQATNDGSFVLADYGTNNFNSTTSNQLSARFTGGVRFVTAGAGMTLDGLPILAGFVNGGQLSGLYTNAVTLTNAGNNFAGNGAGLSNVNATTLNGLASTAFAPASGSSNYIQNQNLGFQNASFQISGNATVSGVISGSLLLASNVNASATVTASALVASNANVNGTVMAGALVVTNNAQFSGLIRSGSETGTGNAPSLAGLVIRRVNSLATTLSNVVARTDVLTLERDGSNEGLLIRYPAGVNRQTINCLAQALAGTNIIVHASLNNPALAGTIQLVASAQHAVHADISFGNTFNSGQMTHVVIDRYDDGATSDYYWVGTLTSTLNQ